MLSSVFKTASRQYPKPPSTHALLRLRENPKEPALAYIT